MYEGNSVDGLPDDYGRLIFLCGSYNEGQFKQDKEDGFGKFVWFDGDAYIG